MAATIARVSGIGLRPGVSLNRRMYTRDAIGRMVERANSQLQSGSVPLTTLTHHGAGDDSTRIVGRLTRVWQDQESGDMRYSGEIADTEHGRTIAKLLDNRDGPPYLKGVSIRGAWASDPRQEKLQDGTTVETGDDIELHGLDYTATPGVPGAEVTDFESIGESAGHTSPRMIRESAPEALVEAASKPYGQVTYADPGYLDKDGKQVAKGSTGIARYPLDTKEHTKAAWAYVNTDSNAAQYSASQLKRIRGRIKASMTKFGVKMTSEGWLMDLAPLAESSAAVLREDFGTGTADGSYYITLTNGPTTVTVSAYCIDPHDLQAVGRAAMNGALGAIATIDPDWDGDMDVPGAPGEDTDRSMGDQAMGDSRPDDNNMESDAEELQTTEADPAEDPDPAEQIGAAETTTTEEVALSDTTVAAAEQSQATAPQDTAQAPAAAGITLSADQFAQLLAAARGPVPAPAAPAESALAVQVAEAQPAAPVAAVVVESEDQRIARMVEERLALRVQELAASGQVSVQRQGLTAPVNETDAPTPTAGSQVSLTERGIPSTWPQKPLHEYSPAERAQYLFPALETYVLGDRARR